MATYQDPEVVRLTQEIESNPSCGDLYAQRDLIYAHISRNPEAVYDYVIAISLEPNNIEFHIYLINELLALDWLSQAKLAIDRVLKLDPLDDEAYSCRARIAFREKIYQDALNDIGHAISINSNCPDYYHLEAQILASSGRPSMSLDAISRAISLQPNNHQLFAFRFHLFIYDLVGTGTGSALHDAERAIILGGDDSEVYFGRGLD